MGRCWVRVLTTGIMVNKSVPIIVRKVEEGVNKFIEWVRDKKLEIRAYLWQEEKQRI